MTDKMKYFKTFCKVSRAFATAIDREDLLDLVVQSAIDAMGAKAACLFLADEKRDIFVPAAQRGLSANYLHAGPEHAKKVVAEILKDGHFYVKDASADSRLENREAKKKEGIASILDVPVKVKDKAVGVLALYTASPREFSQEEIEFLTALAEQGGMAIEQTRLIERTRENARLFNDLASSINSSLDIKKILHILTADVCEALEMKGVNIRLLNKETGNLELVASYGLSEEFLGKGPISADKSVAQALEGETVVIKDARTDKRVQYREHMKKEGIISMLCVPVTAKEEIIGVMRLCSDTQRQFSKDMIALVNAIAHQGGLAIQNAALYLSLEEDKQTLEEERRYHGFWF
jgi:GAF domain-containing protein